MRRECPTCDQKREGSRKAKTYQPSDEKRTHIVVRFKLKHKNYLPLSLLKCNCMHSDVMGAWFLSNKKAESYHQFLIWNSNTLKITNPMFAVAHKVKTHNILSHLLTPTSPFCLSVCLLSLGTKGTLPSPPTP